MTDFIVNRGSEKNAHDVKKSSGFREEGSFVVFYAFDKTQLLALPTSKVYKIEAHVE